MLFEAEVQASMVSYSSAQDTGDVAPAVRLFKTICQGMVPQLDDQTKMADATWTQCNVDERSTQEKLAQAACDAMLKLQSGANIFGMEHNEIPGNLKWSGSKNLVSAWMGELETLWLSRTLDEVAASGQRAVDELSAAMETAFEMQELAAAERQAAVASLINGTTEYASDILNGVLELQADSDELAATLNSLNSTLISRLESATSEILESNNVATKQVLLGISDSESRTAAAIGKAAIEIKDKQDDQARALQDGFNSLSTQLAQLESVVDEGVEKLGEQMDEQTATIKADIAEKVETVMSGLKENLEEVQKGNKAAAEYHAENTAKFNELEFSVANSAKAVMATVTQTSVLIMQDAAKNAEQITNTVKEQHAKTRAHVTEEAEKTRTEMKEEFDKVNQKLEVINEKLDEVNKNTRGIGDLVDKMRTLKQDNKDSETRMKQVKGKVSDNSGNAWDTNRDGAFSGLEMVGTMQDLNVFNKAETLLIDAYQTTVTETRRRRRRHRRERPRARRARMQRRTERRRRDSASAVRLDGKHFAAGITHSDLKQAHPEALAALNGAMGGGLTAFEATIRTGFVEPSFAQYDLTDLTDPKFGLTWTIEVEPKLNANIKIKGDTAATTIDDSACIPIDDATFDGSVTVFGIEVLGYEVATSIKSVVVVEGGASLDVDATVAFSPSFRVGGSVVIADGEIEVSDPQLLGGINDGGSTPTLALSKAAGASATVFVKLTASTSVSIFLAAGSSSRTAADPCAGSKHGDSAANSNDIASLRVSDTVTLKCSLTAASATATCELDVSDPVVDHTLIASSFPAFNLADLLPNFGSDKILFDGVDFSVSVSHADLKQAHPDALATLNDAMGGGLTAFEAAIRTGFVEPSFAQYDLTDLTDPKFGLTWTIEVEPKLNANIKIKGDTAATTIDDSACIPIDDATFDGSVTVFGIEVLGYEVATSIKSVVVVEGGASLDVDATVAFSPSFRVGGSVVIADGEIEVSDPQLLGGINDGGSTPTLALSKAAGASATVFVKLTASTSVSIFLAAGSSSRTAADPCAGSKHGDSAANSNDIASLRVSDTVTLKCSLTAASATATCELDVSDPVVDHTLIASSFPAFNLADLLPNFGSDKILFDGVDFSVSVSHADLKQAHPDALATLNDAMGGGLTAFEAAIRTGFVEPSFAQYDLTDLINPNFALVWTLEVEPRFRATFELQSSSTASIGQKSCVPIEAASFEGTIKVLNMPALGYEVSTDFESRLTVGANMNMNIVADVAFDALFQIAGSVTLLDGEIEVQNPHLTTMFKDAEGSRTPTLTLESKATQSGLLEVEVLASTLVSIFVPGIGNRDPVPTCSSNSQQGSSGLAVGDVAKLSLTSSIKLSCTIVAGETDANCELAVEEPDIKHTSIATEFPDLNLDMLGNVELISLNELSGHFNSSGELGKALSGCVAWQKLPTSISVNSLIDTIGDNPDLIDYQGCADSVSDAATKWLTGSEKASGAVKATLQTLNAMRKDGVMTTAKSKATEMWNDFKTGLSEAGSSNNTVGYVNYICGHLDAIEDFFVADWNPWKKQTKWVMNKLNGVTQAIKTVLTAVDNAAKIAEEIKSAADACMRWIMGMVKAATSGASMGGPIGAVVGGLFGAAKGLISGDAKKCWDGIKKVMSMINDAAKAFVDGFDKWRKTFESNGEFEGCGNDRARARRVDAKDAEMQELFEDASILEAEVDDLMLVYEYRTVGDAESLNKMAGLNLRAHKTSIPPDRRLKYAVAGLDGDASTPESVKWIQSVAVHDEAVEELVATATDMYVLELTNVSDSSFETCQNPSPQSAAIMRAQRYNDLTLLVLRRLNRMRKQFEYEFLTAAPEIQLPTWNSGFVSVTDLKSVLSRFEEAENDYREKGSQTTAEWVSYEVSKFDDPILFEELTSSGKVTVNVPYVGRSKWRLVTVFEHQVQAFLLPSPQVGANAAVTVTLNKGQSSTFFTPGGTNTKRTFLHPDIESRSPATFKYKSATCEPTTTPKPDKEWLDVSPYGPWSLSFGMYGTQPKEAFKDVDRIRLVFQIKYLTEPSNEDQPFDQRIFDIDFKSLCGSGNPTCTGADNQIGDDCKLAHPCAADPCENSATCARGPLKEENTFKCSCVGSRFGGKSCNVPEDLCYSIQCLGGECSVNDRGIPTCTCSENDYSATNDGRNCIPLNTTITTSTSTTFSTTTKTSSTTTTLFNEQNKDCVEEQDKCTKECQKGGERNYKMISDAVKNGKACNGPTDCYPGAGECPITTTTTTTTTSTTTTTTTTTTISTTTGSTIDVTVQQITTVYVPGSCNGVNEAAACGSRIPQSDCTLFGPLGDFAREYCPLFCGIGCADPDTTTETAPATTTLKTTSSSMPLATSNSESETTTATATATTSLYVPGSCNGVNEAASCGSRIPIEDCTLGGTLGAFARKHCPVLCGVPCTTITQPTAESTSTTTSSTKASVESTAYMPATCHGVSESAACGSRIHKEDCTDDSNLKDFAFAQCPVMCGSDHCHSTMLSITTTAHSSTTPPYAISSCRGVMEPEACGSQYIQIGDCNLYSDKGDYARLNCPVMCGVDCDLPTDKPTEAPLAAASGDDNQSGGASVSVILLVVVLVAVLIFGGIYMHRQKSSANALLAAGNDGTSTQNKTVNRAFDPSVVEAGPPNPLANADEPSFVGVSNLLQNVGSKNSSNSASDLKQKGKPPVPLPEDEDGGGESYAQSPTVIDEAPRVRTNTYDIAMGAERAKAAAAAKTLASRYTAETSETAVSDLKKRRKPPMPLPEEDESAIDDESTAGESYAQSPTVSAPTPDYQLAKSSVESPIVPQGVSAESVAERLWAANSVSTPDGKTMSADKIAALLGTSGVPEKVLRFSWSAAKEAQKASGSPVKSSARSMNIFEFTHAVNTVISQGGDFTKTLEEILLSSNA